MRKIISLIHMSLDGYMAGPNGEMDWIGYDAEVAKAGAEMHARCDTAIYGRVTFQMMEGHFQSVFAKPEGHDPGDIEHAKWLDVATKVVFSRTLDSVGWTRTLLIRDNVVERMQALKQQPGKDMWLLASASITPLFLQHGLIDEMRINVNPVVLGKGLPYFGGGMDKRMFTLLDAKTYGCGVTRLCYAPKHA